MRFIVKLKDMPEIEKKIESGALTLTHLGMANTLFRKEETPSEKRIEIIQQLENLSTREAEKIIVAFSKDPVSLKPDRTRALGSNKIELKFVAGERTARSLSSQFHNWRDYRKTLRSSDSEILTRGAACCSAQEVGPSYERISDIARQKNNSIRAQAPSLAAGWQPV